MEKGYFTKMFKKNKKSGSNKFFQTPLQLKSREGLKV